MSATRFSKTLASSLSGFLLLFALLFSAKAMSLTVGDVLTKPTPVNLMLAERSIRAYEEHDWIFVPAQIAGTVDLVRAGHLNHLGGDQDVIFQAAVNYASAVRAGCFKKNLYPSGFCLVDEGLVPRNSHYDPAAHISVSAPWRRSLQEKNLYFDWERHSDPVDWSRVPALDTFCMGLSPERRERTSECFDVRRFLKCSTGLVYLDGFGEMTSNVIDDSNYVSSCRDFIDAGRIPRKCPFRSCLRERFCVEKTKRTCNGAASQGIYIDFEEFNRRYPYTPQK